MKLPFVLRILVTAGVPVLASCRPGEQQSAAPDWLVQRAQRERAMAVPASLTRDFQFADKTAESGITFVDQIVEDAGRNYKAVHYDHGTGLCAADVDGDGRPDLFFVSQLGSSELWKNDGGGHFTNITDAAGVRTTDIVAIGCAFADIDNDGRPDLFVTTVRHGNRLYHNEGGGKFRDISKEAGVDYSGHSSGAVFFDYDNDGLLDLFVANIGVYTGSEKGPGGYYVGLRDAFHGHTHADRGEASVLYHNDGHGKFREVTQAMGLVDFSWSGDAVAFDANGDGFADLYVLDMQGENHLWLNDHGKRFADATSKYFAKTPWGAMGAKAFDANGDGKLDLLVTDMHSDMFTDVAPDNEAAERSKSDPLKMPHDFFPDGQGSSIFGNALFLGGDAAFTDASGAMGVETYWPWGPSVDDFNADGWDDIFVTAGMSFPFRYQPNELLLNDAGRRFIPSAFALGVEPRQNGATEKKWFSIDCDGADKGHLYCGVCTKPDASEKGCHAEGGNKYSIFGTLSSRSSVALDLDGDGDLDLVTHEFNAPPRVLLSDLSTKHKVNWLAVSLHGTKSNRRGIGALVTVVLPDGRRLLKAMDGKSGYLSLSDLPLYFGLATADHAASIEVRWPAGNVQTMPGPVAGGKTVEIREP